MKSARSVTFLVSGGSSRGQAGRMNATTLKRPDFWWFLVLASVVVYNFAVPKHQYNIREVTPVEARQMMAAGAVVVDVRDHADLRLPGALQFPQIALETGLANLSIAKTAQIVVYCGDGSTTGPAATEALNRAGYVNAVNLKSGFQGWQRAGLPTVKG
jgi:rhodanese-related sulfurtransferase